jgi:hypothetical protein
MRVGRLGNYGFTFIQTGNAKMNSLQRVLPAFVFVGTFFVFGVGFTTSAYAQDCHRVHGRIQSSFTSTNCTSPVGLCTEGTITGAGPLDSATTFVALDDAPSAGMAGVEPSANLSYSGVLTITTQRGTLVTHDLGVLDAATASFTEIERPASGTGIFANVSSVFFISGAVVNNGTGFDGELYGELCTGSD